ncbi:MAG: patatin-like phospholipase family protein [Pseudobdellovibrionaceae bacterium]
MNSPASRPFRKINLALQGGGSHGAFTWGVLDTLLEDGRLDLEGISATSAGSMNAVILAQGMMAGGPKKGASHARELLATFWERLSATGNVFAPIQHLAQQTPFGNFWQNIQEFWGSADNPAMQALGMMAQNASPYQFNPLNLNPLRDILGEMVDFERLQKFKNIQLFITATNVRTGNPRIFTSHELTCDMILASAALPNIFQAVEIDGDAYWDGGFMGNPSLWPLFYECTVPDILIVHVNPLLRHQIPKDPISIEERLNEITFNAALLKELRAISFVQKLLHKDMLKDEHRHKYRDVFLHAIRVEESLEKLEIGTKFDTSWPFLTSLRDEGRKAAKMWLAKNLDYVGKAATIMIDSEYLGAPSPAKLEKKNGQ